MGEHKIRCGDHVFHAPSGEDWVVAYADYETGDLAWSGWPDGLARLSDCTLIEAATNAEHAKWLALVLDEGGSRARHARRLYVAEACNG